MASKINIIGIVAWILVVVLAAAAGALGWLGQQRAGQAGELRGALAQLAVAAGVEEVSIAAPAPADASAEGGEAPVVALTADALKDPAVLAGALEQVLTAIQDARMELASAKDSLSAAQNEASSVKTALAQRDQEKTAQADAAAKELAAKEEQLASAKAEAEKALQEAQEAAGKQKAELEGNLASLKTRMEEETARLQAELEAARQAVPAAEAAPDGAPQAVQADAPAGPVAEAPIVVVPAAEALEESEAAREEEGRVVGQSQMFALVRYLEADQTLFFRLLDKQTMIYKNVPPEVYERLIAAGDMLDLNYRFKIQGSYKSLPPDSVVIRKYWKWHRRHKVSGDVRVVESGAMPAATQGTPSEKN